MSEWRLAYSGLIVLLLAVPALAQAPPEVAVGNAGAAAVDRGPQTFVVQMVDKGPAKFVFEPADITVRRGDLVIWDQRGVMPHNVEFVKAPDGGPVKGLPASPFLTTKGQRWEMRIDGQFRDGKYEYICTPHVAMGMAGTITVLPDAAGR